MCGITGVVGSGDRGERLVKAMALAIRHRGPDDDGFLVDKEVALGMRRLAIIDLEHGRQPIVSQSGRFTIFFNGEVYNYQELREELILLGESFETESDTEVVLKMFERFGEESFKRLRGMFAFAIFDNQEGILYLVRDFFGIKPLYYWPTGRLFAFSSEIKSLLEIPEFKPKVNDQAVFNYLSFQYNPLDESFFQGVFKLPPAHFLKLDVKTLDFQLKRYWQFNFRPNESLEKGDTKKEILNALEDSVAHHMIADVPVGSFLSGGIDSSIIATLAQKVRGSSADRLKTFTVGFDTLSEGLEAKETAEPLGTDHKELLVGAGEYFEALPKAVWHFDEPVADPSAIGLYFLAKTASQEVKVVLSGEGSDELFGGYNIYLEPFALRPARLLPQKVLHSLVQLPFNYPGKNYLRRASESLEKRYIGNARIFTNTEIKKLWRGEAGESLSLDQLYQKNIKLSESTRMQDIDIHTWLVGDILAKADKMTMAHSLELRVPFLDTKVSSLASKLPDRFKWAGFPFKQTKFLLRETFKGILPESVRGRKKLGFPTPLRTWLLEEREDVYKTILDNEYIKSKFDVDEIKRIFKAHLGRRADSSRKIYLLLMLALWYNVFIKKN